MGDAGVSMGLIASYRLFWYAVDLRVGACHCDQILRNFATLGKN